MEALSPTTVLGEPLRPTYDVVLAHEHAFIDIRCWVDRQHPLYQRLRDRQVDATTISLVRRHPFACPDNVVLDDDELMAEEFAALTPAAALVVDVTPDDVGRDVQRLAQLSRRTGVDIVTGCGPYIEAAWPPATSDRSEDLFTRRILDQFEAPRPPAVIGEIGTSGPITPAEERSLRGAASAQAELGVPLYVHLHPWHPQVRQVLDIVEQGGGDVERTVLCHLDVTATRSLDDARRALERGCHIAFDIWGDEDPYGDDAMPTDTDRAAAAYALTQHGYGRQLLHSQDVCTKSQLRHFGGAGYAHTHTTGRALLEAAGLTANEIHDQLSANALRLLAPSASNGRGKPEQTRPIAPTIKDPT